MLHMMSVTLFSCLFLIAIHSIGIPLVSGQCSEDQKSLLIELKNSLHYDESESKVLALWYQNSDYCDWVGVTCSDGCVIGLDLNSEGIYGGFDNSSSLFSLRHLKNLNLGHNDFNATIPTGFRNLANLTSLNTSHAGFTGQIPIEVSYLTQLITLDLSTLDFLGSLFSQTSNLKLENPNLELLLQNMTQLRELYLDGVHISAEGEEWGHALSSSLPNLRVLSLRGCDLSGPIDSSLLKIQSLSVIQLDHNYLSVQVPDFFAEYSNLTSLGLSDTGLYGVFPEKIFQVPTLQTLDLSTNGLLQGSLPAFPLNGSLQSLSLSNTDFSGPLPDSIGNLKKLSELVLANCDFNGSIPVSLFRIPSIQEIQLSQNQFDSDLKELSNMSSSLLYIDLSSNQLGGPLPVSLFSIPSIWMIDLSNNQFHGDLNELSNVSSSLLDINLSSNQLGGPFPMSFFKLKGLSYLQMSYNNFSGPLQLNAILQLQNLLGLDLSSNSLFVETNDTISNNSTTSFPQMYFFNLASCRLRRFPEFLKNQTNLLNLDLSNNQLQGLCLLGFGN